MTDTMLPCDRFDALLPDLLEGTLAADDRAAAAAHRASCARCEALVRDLEAIRLDAAALPVLRPSHDLWRDIAERIDAPVVALPGSATATPQSYTPASDVRVVSLDAARSRRRSVAHLSAAAAALVLVTAGVTWEVATRTAGARQPAPSRVASAQPATPPALGNGGIPEQADRRPDVAEPSRQPVAGEPRNPGGASASPGNAVGLAEHRVPAAAPATRLVRQEKDASPRVVMDQQIAALRTILDERRASLDPRTIAILENDLTIIDRAIAESRAALRRDPASRFLEEQLDQALESKLKLLRTAALLPPART